MGNYVIQDSNLCEDKSVTRCDYYGIQEKTGKKDPNVN